MKRYILVDEYTDYVLLQPRVTVEDRLTNQTVSMSVSKYESVKDEEYNTDNNNEH